MKLKETTIKELGVILKDEFNIKLPKKELAAFAHFLVSFFGTFAKFETPPTRSIDNDKAMEEDKGEK